MKRLFWRLYARWCGLSLFLGFVSFILARPGGGFYKTDQFSRFAFKVAGWLLSAFTALVRELKVSI